MASRRSKKRENNIVSEALIMTHFSSASTASRYALKLGASFACPNRGEVAECGGLLIHPALFVLTPFHLY